MLALRIGFTDTAVTVPEGDTAQLCARVFGPTGIIGRNVPIRFTTVDGTAEGKCVYRVSCHKNFSRNDSVFGTMSTDIASTILSHIIARFWYD